MLHKLGLSLIAVVMLFSCWLNVVKLLVALMLSL